jgi:hypothetical protein
MPAIKYCNGAVSPQLVHRGDRTIHVPDCDGVSLAMSRSTDTSTTFLRDHDAADFYDPVVEAYKKDIDRTLLRENLKLTVEQRIQKAMRMHRSIDRMRGAAAADGTASEA